MATAATSVAGLGHRHSRFLEHSRATASSRLSPGSTKPAIVEYRPSGHEACRPSSALSPSVTSTMIAGSSRGKCSAPQAAFEHFITWPALMLCIAEPHPPTVTVTLSPQDHGARIREQPGLVLRELAAGETQVLECGSRGYRGWIRAGQLGGETNPAAKQAEQHQLGVGQRQPQLVP